VAEHLFGLSFKSLASARRSRKQKHLTAKNLAQKKRKKRFNHKEHVEKIAGAALCGRPEPVSERGGFNRKERKKEGTHRLQFQSPSSRPVFSKEDAKSSDIYTLKLRELGAFVANILFSSASILAADLPR
jgi:hypothetical protein